MPSALGMPHESSDTIIRAGPLRLQIIRHQGFRPEGHANFFDDAGRKQFAQAVCRKQSKFLRLAFGDVGAEQVVVPALQVFRHELDEGQVLVALKGIPVVWRGDKPALAYSHHLLRELLLPARSQNMFDDGV